MEAYFCDRCGEAHPTSSITVIEAFRSDGNTRRLGGDLRLEHIELCPRCILDLDALINVWMRNTKVEIHIKENKDE